jgi:signal transduction histidine kinase
MLTTLLTIVVALQAAAIVWLIARVRRSNALLTSVQRSATARVDGVVVLSHELRTPLALILGPVELLLEGTTGGLTNQQRQFLETVRSNAAHLQAIVEDILTQSRIEAGTFSMQWETVDLRSLGLRVVRELRELNRLSIAFDCPGMPPVVRGDARLLLQAMTNLLTNACRHSGGGVVVLRIQRQTRKTLLSVEDHGIGMSPDQRRRAFERFSTTSADQGGTGLGMNITREIVRMHGGELFVQSTPHVGTTTMFALQNA